jgi:hypothetical protein
MLLVLVVPLIIRLLTGAYGRLVATDWLFLGHLIWIAMALAVNNPDRVVQQAPSVGVEFIGGYLVARAWVRDVPTFLAVARRIVMIVALMAPLTLLESRTGTPYLLEAIRALPGIQTLAVNMHEGRLGMERVQSTFAHPIHFGLFCAVGFSMAWVALEGVYSARRRLVLTVVVGVSGFLALSSGALLAIALQLGLIAWATAFARAERRWWWLAGLFALAYVAVDILSNRTPIHVFLSYATFSSHTAYWRMIIFEWGVMNVLGDAENGIPAAPFFGIGLNDWVRPWYMYSGSMDNFWLVAAVRYGLVGLLLLAGGWLMGLGRVMRRPFARDGMTGRARRAWVFTIVGLTFVLCTVHVWLNVYSFVTFVFGMGMFLIHAQDDDEDAGGPEGSEVAHPERARLAYTRFPVGGPA